MTIKASITTLENANDKVPSIKRGTTVNSSLGSKKYNDESAKNYTVPAIIKYGFLLRPKIGTLSVIIP